MTEPEAAEEPLIAALMELERHVGEGGWDQQPRLFALVSTDSVIAAEPELAQQLGLRGSADGGHPDALTAIEQDQFSPGEDLVADLATIAWPTQVYGCALSLESSFLPSDAEAEVPSEPAQAADYVAGHERRQEMRVLAGVDRDQHRYGVGRLKSQPDELLGAQDMVPGLIRVLADTLADTDPETESSVDEGG